MRNLKILFSFILLVFATSLHAQIMYSSKLHFQNFTLAEGLSQNIITCIYQDSKGYIWIGTQAGLNVYDGKTFEIYKNDPEIEGSISDNMILGISEDLQKNIWVATENGLNKFNRDNNTFSQMFYFPEDPTNSISDNTILAILCDNEGNIWIKTPVSIDRIFLNTNQIKKYPYKKDIFLKDLENYNHTLFQDSYGVVWIGTTQGLAYYEPHVDDILYFKNDPQNKQSISNNEVRCIFEDRNNNIWIGTSDGINKFNRKSKNFDRIFNNQSLSINSISQGNSYGELWLATTENGLYKCNTIDGSFFRFSNSQIQNSIISNETTCIIKDRSNILWIGTRNGLSKLDIKPSKFQIIEFANAEVNFNNTNITAILEDQYNIYFGTKSNSLYIYNKKQKYIYNYSPINSIIQGINITSIFLSYSGEVLISDINTIYVFNPKTKVLSYFFSDNENTGFSSKSNIRIKSLYEDYRHNVWIGTNSGVYMYFNEKKRLIHFDKYSNSRLLPSNEINCFFADKNKTLWIGTDEGLARFNYEKHIIEQYRYAKNNKRQHNRNKIYTISQDDNRQLWIGTNVGLFSFNEIDSTSSFYTEKNGLPNNQIFAILPYSNQLWISTNKGLAVFNNNTKEFRSFDPSDGIQGYEFSPNSACSSSDGTMYFGGAKGVIRFHPNLISDNPVSPNLEILKVTYYVDTLKNTIIINDLKSITLPWTNNTLTIHFSAIEFTQPHKNRYKYILEGIDNEWHDIGNQNSINFSKLPPGNYTLKIIGSNNDIVWSTERILQINVETPFWKSIWAYLIYCILFGLALYIFIESRTRSLKIANKTLTEKQEAALEIAKQKEELTQKNKNITDSINYAKRIQWAIMPSRAKFKQLLPNSFILYMPKDIVSGDFYWITEIEDRIFIAAVDCTGHGVPGAFMSIIGYDLLRNITKERKIFKPSEILDYLNKALIELLTKNEMEDNVAVKDGMDISIAVVHKSKGILEYAGAFNPLYIIRNNKIIGIKGDRFSVGLGNEHEDVPFKNHIIKIQRGDMFYMFSDGFADQFGGPYKKKMKFLRFRHLILSIHNLPYIKQARELKDAFNDWKGELEQVDDILVIGFNIDNYLDKIQKR